jgi:autotransporter adhesin
MGMAMDGIPQAFNGKGSIGIGVARFNGHNALAIGASYHDDGNNLTYSIKGAQSGDGSSKENAASAGIGWSF